MKDYQKMAEDLFQRRDHYLAERKRKMNIMIKTLSGVCCLCLAVLTGIRLTNNAAPEAEPYAGISPVRLESQGGESCVSPLPPEPDKENTPAPAITEDKMEKYSGSPDDDSSVQESPEADGPKPESPDIPISEQSPGSLQAIRVQGDSSDFFGGSYTDSQGLLCILLTENTPENRRTICRELNLNENTVVFRNADYTLSYLTDLQTRISEGMISKELDFVVVSALREDTNRLHLTVTTQDPALLDKLQALDSLGGALEIEYTSGSGMIKHELDQLSGSAGS